MTNPFALWLSSLPVFRYPGRVQAQWRPLVCPHCTFLFLRKIHPANLRPNPKSRTRPTSPFRIFPSCCDGDDPRSRVIRLATGTTSRTRTYVLYLWGEIISPGPPNASARAVRYHLPPPLPPPPPTGLRFSPWYNGTVCHVSGAEGDACLT